MIKWDQDIPAYGSADTTNGQSPYYIVLLFTDWGITILKNRMHIYRTAYVIMGHFRSICFSLEIHCLISYYRRLCQLKE
jgi:hypothetical protein